MCGRGGPDYPGILITEKQPRDIDNIQKSSLNTEIKLLKGKILYITEQYVDDDDDDGDDDDGGGDDDDDDVL
jgi:hypothetical protein